jgi:hypothetical protein
MERDSKRIHLFGSVNGGVNRSKMKKIQQALLLKNKDKHRNNKNLQSLSLSLNSQFTLLIYTPRSHRSHRGHLFWVRVSSSTRINRPTDDRRNQNVRPSLKTRNGVHTGNGSTQPIAKQQLNPVHTPASHRERLTRCEHH